MLISENFQGIHLDIGLNLSSHIRNKNKQVGLQLPNIYWVRSGKLKLLLRNKTLI